MPNDEQRFDPNRVREYWTDQARTHGTSPSASWSDTCAIGLEIREILKFLADGDAVLDVGCANGYSTLHYARERKIAIKGLDFIPEMVDSARARLQEQAGPLRGSASFSTGDILSLQEKDSAYDKVVVTRVLINLGTVENQAHALKECARVLRPGGMVILSEASLQGWSNLNRLRAEWGLDAISMPSFNHYLDEDRLFPMVGDTLSLKTVSSFSSSYFVGTRLLKPLMARGAPVAVDSSRPDMEWNRLMAELPPVGDYGTQKLFLLAKKP